MADTYRKTEDLVSRNIVGETIVVPIRGRLADMDNIYALNPVAAHVWKALDEKSTLSDIVSSVVSEFDVGPEDAQADAQQFLNELIDAGLVEVHADD